MFDPFASQLGHALLLAVVLGAPTREELFEAKVFRAADGRTLPYRLFVPEDYTPGKRYPLVLYLHGGGGRGSDNRKQLSGGNGYLVDPLVSAHAQARHACLVVVPQSSPARAIPSTTAPPKQ